MTLSANFQQLNDLAQDASAMGKKKHVLMYNIRNVVVPDFETIGRQGLDLHISAIRNPKTLQHGDLCHCIIRKHRCHRTTMNLFAEHSHTES